MFNRDLLLYPLHGAFWTSFGVAGLFLRSRRGSATDPAPPSPTAAQESTAPFSRSVLAVHFLAFGVMYFGLGSSIIPNQVPAWFPGQRVAGTILIAGGAALMCWARVWFDSWRFRAKLDAGHQLATGGPFHYLRHPIYMGLNLLALGSAVWDPTIIVWIGAGLMVLGSDLRGRSEEKLLTRGFGPAYTSYMQQTRRFLPGIY